MTEYVLALGTAAWLGLLTSISPCPLATNVAAISYLGRDVTSPRAVAVGGMAYTLGRTLAYLGIAGIVLAGLLSMPDVSMTLQRVMNRLIGPILLLVGILLLDWLRLPSFGLGRLGERGQAWAAQRGHFGAVILGALFAVSFCPVSAALFFGSLIPLSLQQGSWLAMPVVFGVGTAIPVVGFAIVVGYGSASLAKSFDKVRNFEKWSRRITAVIFLGVGLYMTISYTF